uniref:BTB domain-containing protein n=1 Tax=Panagrolaimus sp. JU765 TaxID=591449 RepID=A0AC34Q421_9BILA
MPGNSDAVVFQFPPHPSILQVIRESESALMSKSRTITFNVGGRCFQTTDQTIRRISGTRLTALLDEDEEATEFFIDHDPRYFEVVLNFLRSRSFPVDYAEHIIDDVEREAKFYGISELANCCRNLREPLKLHDEEEVDPKCSNVYDVHVDDWSALSHHMQTMTGKIIQVMGQSCCMVKWENDTIVHLPRTALKKCANLLGSNLNDKTPQAVTKKVLTSTASVR